MAICSSPVQVKILPISDKYIDYARQVEASLKLEGLRCEIDERAEKIGYKIREAQLEKIPYMLLVGDKEIEDGAVSVRKRGEGDLGAKSVDEFIASALADIASKKIW